MPIKAYHFSLGNSSKGAVGYCAIVRAKSAKEAVEILKERLPAEEKVHIGDNLDTRVEYCNVYFNESAITVKDIEDEIEITCEYEECRNLAESIDDNGVAMCKECAK
jgi:hypothetical protein